MRAKKNATITDIARLSSVSTATVSRVLNNAGVTRDPVRLKVERAAKELGYVSPRKLNYKREKTSIVLVLAPDLLNPYFNEIIKHLQEAVAQNALECLSTEVRDIRSVLRLFDVMNKQLIRGVVLFGGILSNQEVVTLADRLPFPVVLINQIVEGSNVLCINIDYARATYLGTIHLLELGHRNFAFVGGRSSDTGQEKIKGVQRALQEHGLSADDLHVMSGEPTTDWGFHATSTLLKTAGGTKPTGMICSCDLIALGTLHAIRSLNFSVPDDFSVMGFDDISMACHADPALTTISPPKDKISKLAASLIISPSTKPHQIISNYVMLESHLVVRSSTGKRRS